MEIVYERWCQSDWFTSAHVSVVVVVVALPLVAPWEVVCTCANKRPVQPAPSRLHHGRQACPLEGFAARLAGRRPPNGWAARSCGRVEIGEEMSGGSKGDEVGGPKVRGGGREREKERREQIMAASGALLLAGWCARVRKRSAAKAVPIWITR